MTINCRSFLAPGVAVELTPGVEVVASGGHTRGSINVLVHTAEGSAALVGDLLYDLEGALHNRPAGTPTAGVQPYAFTLEEPATTNNFTPSIADEIAAVKAVLRNRFLLPAHDRPGVVFGGRLVGRIEGPTVPGPITPLSPIQPVHQQHHPE